MSYDNDDETTDPLERGRARDRMLALTVAHVVGAATGVRGPVMLSRHRVGVHVCRARWAALYLCHIALGWPLHRVGLAFERDRQTVSLACRWAEDARDDPDVDAFFEAAEADIRRIADYQIRFAA